MTVLYGIPNCDTVKKARKWLDNHHIDYRFHDFRKDGLEETTVSRWAGLAGWETLLNRRGTTWRQLPESVKDGVNETSAIPLMTEQPTLIKRPVLELNGTIHVGFKEADYCDLFKQTR